MSIPTSTSTAPSAPPMTVDSVLDDLSPHNPPYVQGYPQVAYAQPAPTQATYAQPVPAQAMYAAPPAQAPAGYAYAQPMPAQPMYAQPPVPMYAQPPPQQQVLVAYPPMYDEKHAVRMGNFIFLGTYGKIRALEVCDGTLRTVWTEELKGCGYHMVHLKLFIGRGQLYAATNGHVFCIEALTGKTIWKAKPDIQHGILASDLVTLLLTYDGSILVTASNGALVAYNAQSGHIIWQTGIKSFSGSHDAYALVEHNGLLFVGNEGHVFAYYMINGQLKWKNGLSGFGYCPISLAAYAFAPPTGGIYDILFVGTYGYVLALDGQTGSTRHHVNLDGTGYKPVALLLDPPTDTLYTATSGELRCFKADSMTQLWKSNLPGMGYSFGHSLLFGDQATIIIGMHGKVSAINKASSKMEWQISLPGCGYHLVTVASMANPNVLICGSSGKLYCIDKHGCLKWKDGLSGLGYAEISISTTTYNTDFNSTTLPHSIEMERRQQRSNGAAGAAIASSS